MNGNIHKVWGERRRIFLSDRVELDLLYLKKDSFCSTHSHKYKVNKFIVVEGKVKIETDFGHVTLEKNQSWQVYPRARHRFVPLTDAIMIEIASVGKGNTIDPTDIDRISQGGKVIDGKEMTHNELRDRGLLDL